MKDIITASAPGTLMLTGEHAVLHGYPALVCAVDQRMQVTLSARNDTIFTIHSPLLGDFKGDIATVSPQAPFEFITTIIASYQTKLTTGFDLHIQTDFSHTVGLGSSSAVTVATIAVIAKYSGETLIPETLWQKAYDIILQVQKVGSGADLAASIWGGLVFFQNKPFLVEPLSYYPALALLYSGSKKRTAEVINYVQQHAEEEPTLYQHYFKALGDGTVLAKKAIEEKNDIVLGAIFNEQYAIQKSMKLTTESIEYLIEKMNIEPQITGSKISGSGLGDSVVGIGTLSTPALALSQLVVHIDKRGLQYE